MEHNNEGLVWLRQQLAWERRLAELRRAHRDRTSGPTRLVDYLVDEPAA